MEYSLLKMIGLSLGVLAAWLVKKKYPDFPNGKKQVAILTIILILMSIGVFTLFIS